MIVSKNAVVSKIGKQITLNINGEMRVVEPFSIIMANPITKEKSKIPIISPIFLDTIDPISAKNIKYHRSMKPIQVSLGGRFSFKTTTHMLKILMLMMKYKYIDFVFVRKIQSTH
jgi:hypothetical protein